MEHIVKCAKLKRKIKSHLWKQLGLDISKNAGIHCISSYESGSIWSENQRY